MRVARGLGELVERRRREARERLREALGQARLLKRVARRGAQVRQRRLRARKTPPRTMKRSPEALSRVFANHKDLARALKRWAPKGCRLEGMILDTKGTRSFRCNAARACDHFKELERACRGGGEC